MAGTYDGITTCAIQLPEQIKFANYAYIAPRYDMNRKRIKHTRKGVMHRLAITVFPESTRSWVLMSCMDCRLPILNNVSGSLFTDFLCVLAVIAGHIIILS